MLLGRKVSLLGPLVLLSAIPVAEKRAWSDKLATDTNLQACLTSGNFLPAGPSPRVEAILEAVMTHFYDALLTKGVQAEVMGDLEPFDRQDLLDAYTTNNPRIQVCPGCDGDGPRGVKQKSKKKRTLKRKVLVDLDHFFPRSRYPLLAVHPLNLVPLCSDCNEDFKQSKDAGEAPGVTSLHDIFHPYERPALPYVEVLIQRNPRGTPELRLLPKGGSSQARARLASLNHLLELEARWQDNLDEHRYHNQLWQNLVRRIQGYAEGKSLPLLPIPRSTLVKWLNSESQDARRQRGEWPDLVALSAYAAWLSSDPRALADIYAEVDRYVASLA